LYEVIYMKADFEPWWMFEGWEETIVSRQVFNDSKDAKVKLVQFLEELRKEHDNVSVKNECFFSFWSDKEKVFCEACDEDLQLYHGVFVTHAGKPIVIDRK
jgi:hypothetical protein